VGENFLTPPIPLKILVFLFTFDEKRRKKEEKRCFGKVKQVKKVSFKKRSPTFWSSRSILRSKRKGKKHVFFTNFFVKYRRKIDKNSFKTYHKLNLK